QLVHLASSFVIEPESDRAAHQRVLENALSNEQMLFHGEKSVQACLQGNQRRQWAVDALRPHRIASLQRAPEPDERSDEVRTGHGADHAVLMRFDEGDAAGALEDAGASIRSVQ